MFILTSDIKEIFYAICVVDDCLKNWPTFIPLQGDSSQVKPNYNRTRCYMIISRWPFFPLFFDVLYSILGAEEANQSFQNDLAEQLSQNMVLRIMETVLNTPLPAPGESLSLPFSNIAPFRRPPSDLDEDEIMYTELCVPLLFYALELDQILLLMSCVLLEKKILFISSNVRLVTGCLYVSSLLLPFVFCSPLTYNDHRCAFMPLVRPFVLQCVIIPIVPERLTQILQAPVPFIVGMANVQWARNELPQLSRSEIVVVDLDAKKIHLPVGPKIPLLPDVKPLQKTLEAPYKELTKTFHSSAPYRATPDQFQRADDVGQLIEEHFFAPMFQRFKHHCVTNLTDNVTVFLKESYLAEETTPETEVFFEGFLETQIFQIFSDGKLRDIDNYLPRQRTSASPRNSDDALLPRKIRDVVDNEDEGKRGDIAWDPTSLVSAEDMESPDEVTRKRAASASNGVPVLGISPRTGSGRSTASRLLADRGRSHSSTGFMNSSPRTEEPAPTPVIAPAATDTPKEAPYSPIRKPVIPAGALKPQKEAAVPKIILSTPASPEKKK